LADAFGGKAEPLFHKVPSLFDQVNHLPVGEDRRRKEHIASSWKFNATLVVMVIANSVILGVELDHPSGTKLEERFGYFLADLFFLIVFFAEMLIRQNQQGWSYFLDNWNLFDFLIVVFNCLDIVLAVTSVESARIATTIRIIRLLRASKYIGGVRLFRGAWLVIEGLVSSLRVLAWTGLFMIVVVYSLGVALATLVGQDPIVFERWNDADQYVGSVYRSMMTVCQVWTFDHWTSSLLRPLSDLRQSSGVVILALAIVVCNFGVLNIVIALMVERLSKIKQEQDLKNGKFLKKIEEAVLQHLGDDFRRADANSDGDLDYKEFSRLIRQPHVSQKLRLLGIYGDEADSMFDILDADRSGTLTPEEFIDGLQRIRGPARSKDICALISFAQRKCNQAKQNVERTRRLIETVDSVQSRLDAAGKFLSAEVQDRKVMKERGLAVWRGARARHKVIDALDRDRGTAFPSLKEYEDNFLSLDTPDLSDGRHL